MYILRRTSPKVAGINDDMSPGSALEHSEVWDQPDSFEKGGTRTMEFSLGIESNLIDGIAVSHAIVKHRLIDDHMFGG